MADSQLQNILGQWNEREWRVPDYEMDGYAIWFGPGKDPEAGTEIEAEKGGWTISEYQNVNGLIDDPQADFLKISNFVSYKQFAEAVDGVLETIEENAEEPKMLRSVVGFGVAKITYYGGDEEWVDEIPHTAEIK